MRRAIAVVFGAVLLLAGCARDAVLTDAAPETGGHTALVAFDTTPFPFHGTAPGAAKPFMDVDENGRLGHSSGRNGVLWEDRTYADKRVLLSIPPDFDPKRPSTLVVFLHGNGAILQRDVLARQGVARQVAASRLNAVLVAPQFAVDARDSSAGRFWEPGVFGAFLDEAAGRLAALAGSADAEAVFARAPVILVAYSGGYLPAAAALRYGESGGRIRGVVLLDALYGEADTFASYAEGHGGFLVSLYGRSSRPGNEGLRRRLAAAGLPAATAPGPIGPDTLAFLDAGDGVAHGDFVTAAFGGDTLAAVLSRIEGFGRAPTALADLRPQP